VPTQVRLHREAFSLHLFTKCAESSDRVDTRFVPLLSMQTAHLRYENLGSADFHAVNHMRNLHTRHLNHEKHCNGLFSA
jgi:hypothetical protein